MAVNIGPRIGIDGEAEYRKQIKNIIQETKTLKSEYEKTVSAFDKGEGALEINAAKYKLLTSEIEAHKKRIAENNAVLEEARKKRLELTESILSATVVYGQDSEEVQKLTKEVESLEYKTQTWTQVNNKAVAELNELERELKNLPTTLQIIGTQYQEFGKKISDAGSKIQSWGSKLTPLSTIAAGSLAGSTKAFIDFETAMTGVQKTVDGTEKDFQELGSWIKQASTEMASSKEDIAGTMEIAGQLGVSGVKNLENFTKTMVMLGDTTNLSSEEASTALARFMNITGTSYDDTSRLGSAIVDLGNNFATSESEITEMATRLAAAGTVAGLSETDILALSAAMTSVGINAEAGGTAMTQTFAAIEKAVSGIGNSSEEVEKADKKVRTAYSSWRDAVENAEKKQLAYNAAVQKSGANSTQAQKAFIDLGTAERHASEKAEELSIAQDNLEKVSSGVSDKLSLFASVAGMAADEFAEAWKTKPAEALQAFITGLGNLDGESENTIALLDSLELSGVRQSNMLQSLGLASDMLGSAIEKSNEAWDKNVALQDEAGKKYSTTAAQLQQSKEKITNVALEIGERMLPYLDRILGVVDELITEWDKLDTSQKDAIVNGVVALAALAPTLSTIGQVVSGIGAVVSTVGAVLSGGIATVVAGIAGIGIAVTAVIDMIKNGWSLVSTILEAVGLAIAAVAAVIVVGVSGVAIAIAAAVAATVFAITQAIILIKDHWTEITAFFKGVIDSWAAWWKAFCQAMGNLWQGICNTVKNLWNGVTNTLSGFFNTLQTRFSNAINNLQNSFTNFVRRATGWGRDLMDNFIDGIRSMWDRLVDTVSDIADTIADYLGFSEPEKGPLSNFHTYAPDMMKLFAKGIRDNENVIQSQIERSFDFSDLATEAFTTQATPYAYMPDTTTNNSVSIGSTQIIINATEGQSVYEIADAVDEIINQRYQRAQAAWA